MDWVMDWLPEFFQKFPPLAMVAVTFNTFDQQGQRLTERFALKIVDRCQAEQPV